MIKKDIFCKFLFYDKILESKEFKNNKYFLILGYFLTNKEIFIKSDKDKKEKIQDNLKPDRKSLIKVFINYINKINNKMKLYQYLKFIFYNCDLMKENIRKESEFFEKLTVEMNIIDTTHCKYCKYNQNCFYIRHIILNYLKKYFLLLLKLFQNLLLLQQNINRSFYLVQD